MSDMVAVEFELTHEDWVSAVSAHAEGTHLGRRELRKIRLAFGLTMAALVLLLLWGGSLTAASVAAVFGAVWVTALPAFARRRHRRALRKVAEEGIARGTFGRHRVVLTDEGILDVADGYDLLIHWGAVEKVEDTGTALLIYNGPHAYLTVPLSAFPDRSVFEAFSSRFFQGLEEAGHLASLTGEASRGGEPSRPR